MVANKTEFGEALKSIRIGLNLTQMEVSKSTGIPQTTITRFEKGAGTIENLITLIKFFTSHSPDYEIDVFNLKNPITKKEMNRTLNFISIERLKDLRDTINAELKGILLQMNNQV